MEQKKRQEKGRREGRMNPGAGVFALLIFLIFRILVTNIIGDEGNGYLAVSGEIYGLFYLLFGYGYTKAITRMVRTRMERNLYLNSIRVMKNTVLAGLISSLAGAAVLYALRGTIAELLPSGNMVEISMILFIPLLPIKTLVGMFRGYFEGMGTGVPTEVSRLIEAVITATGAFIFVFITSSYGIKVADLLHNEHYGAGFASAGVVAGYLCGNLLALIFLSFVYVLYKTGYNRLLKKDMSKALESRRDLFWETLLGVFSGLSQVLFLRIYLLVNLVYFLGSRRDDENALASIKIVGSFYGKIIILISMAVVLILTLTKTGKRRKSTRALQHEIRSGKYLLGDELQRLFSLAIPVMGSLIVLSKTLLKTLYKTAGKTEIMLLCIAGVNLVFLVLGIYLYRLMADLDRKKQSAVIGLIAFVVQTFVLVGLGTAVDLEGFSLSTLSLGLAPLVFWIVFSLGQLFFLLRLYPIRLPWRRMVVLPLIQTGIMVVVELIIVRLSGNSIPSWSVCLLAVGMGGLFHQLTGRVPVLNMV